MIKIKSIEFINDEFFGNKLFDFTINGLPAMTIVLAGKNGVGKTRLLNYIYRVCNQQIGNTRSNIPNIYSKVSFDIRSLRIYYESNIIDTAVVKCGFSQDVYYYEVEFSCNGKVVSRVFKDNEGKERVHSLNLKTLFSTVDITYTPSRQINSVSNRQLDQEDTTIPNDLASDIIQLLVDIKSLPAAT